MGDFKFAQNLFLEVAELNRLKKYLRDDGYQLDFKNNYEKVGIVRNIYYDPNFTYFRAVDVNVAGNVKVNPGFAYDINRNVLTSVGATLLIPTNDTWYWLKIKYKINNIEKGTITIGGSAGGLMTGINTEFTKILRGQPNFPSKISFIDSTNYNQQYEILEVVDDNNAYVQGSFATKETNLQYAIVGTFTPGTNPAISDQYPFIYDDFDYEFVPETALDTIPSTLEGAEFFIARIQQPTGQSLIIQDKRYLFVAKTRTERLFEELPSKPNPIIGIEYVTRTSLFQKVFFTVNFQWGLRIGQENRDYNQNKVTIISGNGGVYGSANAFTTGDFDNWRYYYSNGEYSQILSSVKNNSGIDLFLDSLKSESAGAMVCPNAEEIEISLAYSVSNNGLNQVYKTILKKFYIFTLNPQLIIDQDELDPNILEVDLLHRFKTIYRLTSLAQLNLSLYSVAGAAPVLSQNVLLSFGQVLPPTSSAWRGIDPFCVIDSLGAPIYYKIVTQNTTVIPTQYTPNSTSPLNSFDQTTADIVVQFFSDSGRTVPVNVTHVNLRVAVLVSSSTNTYSYDSWSGTGSGTPSTSVRQIINSYIITVNGVNSVTLATLDTVENSYFHPSQTTGVRNAKTLVNITYSEIGTQLTVGNTGQKGYSNLEQYVVATNLPTGVTKPNDPSDSDYIAPLQDTLNCPTGVQYIAVTYYADLKIDAVTLTGVINGTKNAATVANTQDGGYQYVLTRFDLNESTTVTVNVNQQGTLNTSGFIWVRVIWSPTGSSATTSTQIQVPMGVPTLLSQTFVNIQAVSISNY